VAVVHELPSIYEGLGTEWGPGQGYPRRSSRLLFGRRPLVDAERGTPASWFHTSRPAICAGGRALVVVEAVAGSSPVAHPHEVPANSHLPAGIGTSPYTAMTYLPALTALVRSLGPLDSIRPRLSRDEKCDARR
jgi:hypothetical protein